MADAGYKLDTKSTSGADAFTQGGSAVSGTGAMNYNNPGGVPVWMIVAGAAAALFAFFTWRRKK